MIDQDRVITAIRNHLDQFWPKRAKRDFVWIAGPAQRVLPDFRVCRIESSTPTDGWVYVSLGISKIHSPDHMEFFILSPIEDPIHVENLAMVAYFHADPCYGVHLGKIINIGRAWMNGATCDQFLVSLPYPLGPGFEWCNIGDMKIRFLWLLPITAAEAEFMRAHGQEALER